MAGKRSLVAPGQAVEDLRHGLNHDVPADIGRTWQVDGELPFAREITQRTDSP